MHWAITGQTAAEIIYQRADSSKQNMGLTTWRGTKVRKQDTEIAKNYLSEEELLALNNLTEQYLVFAEGQALRRIPMYMQNWIDKLNGFLELNDRNILEHSGKITHQLAIEHAHIEYGKYNAKMIEENDKKESDFDKSVMGLLEKKEKSIKKITRKDL